MGNDRNTFISFWDTAICMFRKCNTANNVWDHTDLILSVQTIVWIPLHLFRKKSRRTFGLKQTIMQLDNLLWYCVIKPVFYVLLYLFFLLFIYAHLDSQFSQHFINTHGIKDVSKWVVSCLKSVLSFVNFLLVYLFFFLVFYHYFFFFIMNIFCHDFLCN